MKGQTMQMITGKCPECNEDIVPADNQAQFNRNLGLYRRARHGIVGRRPSYHEGKPREPLKPAARYAKQIETLAKARRKRWREYKKRVRMGLTYKQQYKPRKHSAKNGAVPPPVLAKATSEAQPCNLPACPVCGSRFFVVKGT